jgi:hypothetical protein
MTIVGGIGPMQIKAFLDSLGEKAPPVQYVAATGGDFDGEKLTADAKKSTVLIIAIRGAPADSGTATESGSGESGGKEAKPSTGAGKKGATGAGVGAAG